MNALKSFDTKRIVSYSSGKEAKLDMVRTLRKQYGDTMNMGTDVRKPHVDLALYETYILNNHYPITDDDMNKLNW